jgi:predicted DNA-binding transcriptional regulator AlpA
MGRATRAEKLPTFINQREIAREFGGADSRTIIRWSQSGRFPRPVKVVGTTRLFDRAEVERFFRSRVEPEPVV